MRALVAIAAAALAATTASAAGDCLDPLVASPRWSCHTELSRGEGVDFCLERTNVFGGLPAARRFNTVATGPFTASCTCRAKGAAFGEDPGYLCVDRETSTVVAGRISKKRILAETFNVNADVRGKYTCTPDPNCEVQDIVDPDLTPKFGFLQLKAGFEAGVAVTGGGPLDMSFTGCVGHTTEEPTFVFRGEPGVGGDLSIDLSAIVQQDDVLELMVVDPSGARHCHAGHMNLPIQPGPYAVWFMTEPANRPITGVLHAKHTAVID